MLGRLRATVLVADGMLSAFENVGRPDPDAAASAIAIGGHGGELLRGGYAKIIPGSAARRAAGSAELLRRLTMRRVPLLRARWRTAYLASLTPWAAAVAAHPQPALDDFYLVNRAGRWSAAARQAYAIRSVMAQPFFDDQVVRAARIRAAGRTPRRPPGPRRDRRAVPGAAGHPARRRPLEVRPGHRTAPRLALRRRRSPVSGPASTGGAATATTWPTSCGTTCSAPASAGGLFAIVSRPAAERLLRPPHTDPGRPCGPWPPWPR